MKKVIAYALLAACSPSWAVFKCVGVAGSVSYQEQPCQADARAISKLDIKAQQASPASQDFSAQIANGEIAKGMSMEQVRTAWGEPTHKSVSDGSVRVESWRYNISKFVDKEVTFLNGKVVKFFMP